MSTFIDNLESLCSQFHAKREEVQRAKRDLQEIEISLKDTILEDKEVSRVVLKIDFGKLMLILRNR